MKQFYITSFDDTMVIGEYVNEVGSCNYLYGDLFDFNIGQQIKLSGKIWRIISETASAVQVELKADTMYQREFTKKYLVQLKYQIGEILTYFEPEIMYDAHAA